MGVQELLVIGLFVVALFYVGGMIYRNFQAKQSCGQNCKCGIDFSNITAPEEKK